MTKKGLFYKENDMTKREAAIVSAYTGYLIGEFKDFHVFTHELPNIAEELEEKSKKDFMSIKIEEDEKKESGYHETLGGYRKCKYGDHTKFGLTCEYLRSMIHGDKDYKFPCPADSGTDGKRNGVCYEYTNFTKRE